MEAVSIVPLELAVDIKPMVDKQGNDLVVTGLGSQEEGAMGHARTLQVAEGELT